MAPPDGPTPDATALRTDPGLPPEALAALEASLRDHDRRGPRTIARRLGAVSTVLVLAVVGSAGFLAGVQVQKHQETSSSTGLATTGTGSGGAGGGAGATGRFGAAAGTGAGATTASTAASGATNPTATTGATGATGGARAGVNGPGPSGSFGGRRGGVAGTTPASGVANTTGTSAPAATGGTGAAGGAQGQRGGAGGAGGAGGGNATVGQVKVVDGKNLYVTDNQGNLVKVVTSDSSRFTKTSTGTITDVHPGDTVIVQGPKDADGTVTAVAVADNSSGGGD